MTAATSRTAPDTRATRARRLARDWLRGLPERHGGWAVIVALALIAGLALTLRVISALDPLEVRPGTDSAIYETLARRLYETHHWTIPGSERPYDWSPGAPLFYAAIYAVIGQANALAARLIVALLGALTTLVAYLIGRRLAGPLAGVVGALLVAVYPVTIYYTGKLMSEPVATLTLAGAVLAFLWAGERPRRRLAWALPGVLLGFTALARPEYLAFALVFGLLALLRAGRASGWRPGVAAAIVLVVAFALPVAPWTAYVSHAEGRFVPLSTGGGKALFIGTYLPGNGLHLDVKRELIRQTTGRTNLSATELSRTPMTPLLDRVAAKYPDLPRDAALQRIGRENAVRYVTDDPVAFAGMLAGKVGHMWQASGADGRSSLGTTFQYVVLLLGAVGLGLLALARRWETLPLVALLAGVTVLGGLLLAGTRRNVPLMPLVMALAGVAVAAAVRRRRVPAADRQPASRYLGPP